jgi:cytochrome c553
MKKSLILATLLGTMVAFSVSAADVKETWDKTCAKCHGADGKGQTKMGAKVGVKDFTDPKVQEAFTDDHAFKSLKEGIKDADGKIRMKPVENLTDDDIKALVKQVRSFKP